MYNKSHLYDLSFVSPRGGRKGQFVFTLEAKRLDELNKRLSRLVGRVDVKEYLGIECEFKLPMRDLFGNIAFGFGSCGFASFEKEKVRLSIELAPDTLPYAVFTMQVLSRAVLFPFEETSSPNRQQQLDLEMICTRDAMHGHSVGGYISGSVLTWLKAQGSRALEGDDYVRMPEQVIDAMRDAWFSVNPKSKKRNRSMREDIRGMIGRDGRFILMCPGNACDLAIYPDNFIEGGNADLGTRFSCHNLDRADQQVTLLAGLAKLCELARAEH